jgi:hypothetical protein
LKASARYATPTRNDIAVIVPFFSPAGFAQPLHNLRRVLGDLAAAGIPYYLAEMVYDEPLTSPPHTLFYSKSPMFHKENLCNLMARQVPERYTKLVFLDGDIQFTREDWLDACSKVLDECDIATPMDECSWGGSPGRPFSRPATSVLAVQGKSWTRGQSHPGFALAMTRKWFEASGGWYEESYLGSGDVCFWQGITRGDVPEDIDSAVPRDSYREWCRKLPPARIGYVTGCVAVHMWHGDFKDRRYTTRAQDYTIKGTLYRTPDGVLELTNEEDRKLVASYFTTRKEDGEVGGPGTELKALLAKIGITSTPTCSCNRRAKTMDEKGCDWCEQNIDEIVGWLKEEHARRKSRIPFIHIAVAQMVKLAIRRARKKDIK